MKDVKLDFPIDTSVGKNGGKEGKVFCPKGMRPNFGKMDGN